MPAGTKVVPAVRTLPPCGRTPHHRLPRPSWGSPRRSGSARMRSRLRSTTSFRCRRGRRRPDRAACARARDPAVCRRYARPPEKKVTATIFTLDPSMPNGVTKMVAVTFFLVQFAVKRRGRERRPVHREEVPLGAIYRFGRHRRRLAARPHSAPAGESGVRADHARAGGRGGPRDRWGVCSCRTVTGLRFTTEAARRVVCRA
jgi:hypothetical protein